jgi:gas vesicle protein
MPPKELLPFPTNTSQYSQLERMQDSADASRAALKRQRDLHRNRINSFKFRKRREEERKTDKAEIDSYKKEIESLTGYIGQLEEDVVGIAMNDGNNSLSDVDKEIFGSLQTRINRNAKEVNNTDVGILNNLRSRLGAKQLYPLQQVSDDRSHQSPPTYPTEEEDRDATPISSIVNRDNEPVGSGYAGASEQDPFRSKRPYPLPQALDDGPYPSQPTYQTEGKRSAIPISSILIDDKPGDPEYAGASQQEQTIFSRHVDK